MLAVAAAVGVVTFIVAVVDVTGIVAGWKLFWAKFGSKQNIQVGQKTFLQRELFDLTTVTSQTLLLNF